jgi:hypothetical protein
VQNAKMVGWRTSGWLQSRRGGFKIAVSNHEGSDRPYHYFGSAIWFTCIGHAAGEAMLELLKDGDGTAAVPRTPSKHWANRRVP